MSCLVRLALKFLDMFDRLEYGVDGVKPLIFCDLKMEHFHFDSNSQLRIIDGTDLLFRDRYGKFVMEGTNSRVSKNI